MDDPPLSKVYDAQRIATHFGLTQVFDDCWPTYGDLMREPALILLLPPGSAWYMTRQIKKAGIAARTVSLATVMRQIASREVQEATKAIDLMLKREGKRLQTA